MSTEFARFELRTADNLSGLEAAVAKFGRVEKLALFLRVPGEYEDGSREKAHAAVKRLLSEHRLADRAEMVTVVGCEGATTPCGFAFAGVADDGAGGQEPRLSIGVAHGKPPADDEIDTAGFALKIAELVGVAIADGGMAAQDVVTVFVNTPAPAAGNKGARARRARAVAALGAGIALGEIDPARVTDKAVATELSLYARRVQTFAGPTVKQVEVIVLGNRAGIGGHFVARATLTNDLFDVRSLKRLLVDAGLRLDADGEIAEPDRVVAALIKSGVAANGEVLGQPTAIFGGGLPPEKHVRATQSGVFGALLRTTRMFNTYDPIHQAPEGGAHACCIIRQP
jgi:cyanuric acid amidohydrolase